VLPRLFGFSEYADLTDLLLEGGVSHHVLAYDWRRDLVESARRLDDTLEELADAEGDPDARFNVIGHSMGGLIARYYLRFGRVEPDESAPVTWAGARRIRTLVLVATPNGGGIPALDAILHGNRVGLSSTTLAATVIATMPAIYQLLPPGGAGGLLDHRCDPLAVDLHDAATWERFGWGPFAPPRPRRGASDLEPGSAAQRAFLSAVLERARAVHRALARPALTPCPSRVVLLGGDCLPTTARAVVPERRGSLPRFDPWTPAEAEAMLDAGDGRVTRASVLASHLLDGDDSDLGCSLPEVGHAFFGSADHHGVYREPTFQSIILRLLLRPAGPPPTVAAPAPPE
jgi:pimeloyl-ACP methyl ester carboxylesterase